MNIGLRLSPVLSNSHKKAAREPTALVSYEYFIACLKLGENSFTAQKHLSGLWTSLQAHGACPHAHTSYEVTLACGQSHLTLQQTKFVKPGWSFGMI